MKFVLITLFTLCTLITFGQKVSSLSVIYNNTFDQAESTIETHLEENKLSKVINKIKDNQLFVKSKSDNENLITDSKRKQYSFKGRKDYFCNSCNQIEEILNKNKSLTTALFIIDPSGDFDISDCEFSNLPDNVVSIMVKEDTDLYNEVYKTVQKKANTFKRNYAIVLWSPGKNLKGLDFAINNKFQEEITANFNDKITVKMSEANNKDRYSLTVNDESVDYNLSSSTLSHSFIVKKNTTVCLSNNTCPEVCKTIEVKNACTDCKSDVGLDLDFDDNKYAKTDNQLKKAGIDYEILQGKQGYKLFYFVVKNQPCVESYELQMSLKYIGDDEDKKRLNGKSKTFPLEVSDEETGDNELIILKADYSDLYDDGSGVIDDEMICTMKIVVKKCSGKITGSSSKSYKVIFQKCN
jgi:hypothetical protein